MIPSFETISKSAGERRRMLIAYRLSFPLDARMQNRGEQEQCFCINESLRTGKAHKALSLKRTMLFKHEISFIKEIRAGHSYPFNIEKKY